MTGTSSSFEHLFKIVLVGNAGVGKTALVRQFAHNTPPNLNNSGKVSGATIGVDFMIKSVKLASGCCVKLQLWDTAGQERFRSITQSYYRSAHALILVYDISSQPSFDALHRWIKDVDAVLDRTSNSMSTGNSSLSNNATNKLTSSTNNKQQQQVLQVLVGNKSDKDGREIPTSIAEKFRAHYGLDLFVETSAFDTCSVEKLFVDIAEILTSRSQHQLAAAAAASASASASLAASSQTTKTTDNYNYNSNDQRILLGVSLGDLTNRAKTCLNC